jgi:hypothetical protein
MSRQEQQKLFDDLYTRVSPEQYTATLKALAAAADERTAGYQSVRDQLWETYKIAEDARAEAWNTAWAAARDQLLEGKK